MVSTDTFNVGHILITACIGLLFAGLFGGGATYLWDGLRRRREADLDALGTFYATYGEWFAIWKLWEAKTEKKYPSKGDEKDARDELLRSATATEGKFETLLVKIALERRLDDKERERLARFREGYQSLREHIECNKKLEWRIQPKQGDDEKQADAHIKPYIAFKALATEVAVLLSRRQPMRRRPALGDATGSLLRMTSWRSPEAEPSSTGYDKLDADPDHSWWGSDAAKPGVWPDIERRWRAIGWLPRATR